MSLNGKVVVVTGAADEFSLLTSLDTDQCQILATNLHGYAVDMVELANKP